MDSISHNQIWQLMKLPLKKRPIIKWTYKVKNDYNGKPSKYKARIMVKGFEQRKDLVFQQTHAPIIKWSIIKYVMALVTYYGWKISQMDGKTTFLNGDFQEEVHMKHREGFI